MDPLGDERLRPVEDIAAAAAVAAAVVAGDGAGLHALQIRAAVGLGHGEAGDHLARGHAGEPALLLLRGAVARQVVCGDHVDLLSRAPAGIAGAAKLVGEDRLVREGAAGAAVLGRDVRQEEAELARLAPHGAVGGAGLEPALLVRRDVLGDEPPRELAQRGELLGHPVRLVALDHGALRARTWRFRSRRDSLPIAVFGSSERSSSWRGISIGERRSFRCVCSSSRVSVAPARTTTKALMVSPRYASGDAEDQRLGDGRVGVHRLLDVDRVDVVPAGDDHVLQPVDDEEEAALVEVADVAGAEHAVDRELARLLRELPVAPASPVDR